MRDYSDIDRYLDRLKNDIYDQPQDRVHTMWSEQAVDQLLPTRVRTVLDVGCGHGFMAESFTTRDVVWTGVTMGGDYYACRSAQLNVKPADMSFLPFKDADFDLIYARHVLEHSPFPILTLMEWHRVSKEFLILIAPAPDYWTYAGKNHYSVAVKEQLIWWLKRAGWFVIKEHLFTSSDPLFLRYWREDLIDVGHLTEEEAPSHFSDIAKIVEYRFLCKKGERQTT